jgi:amino acid adenylation domain-containing protein
MTQLLPTKTSFTLSQLQQRIWFLYKLASEGINDKISFAIRIKSPVDRKAIKKAFQKLIDRHATLRSYYHERDGQLIQEIQNTVEVNLEEIDASTWSWNELKDHLLKSTQRPFNLEQGSVVRLSLFSRSATEHVLLLTVHQIASDWWSLLVLVDELFVLYASHKNGTNADLPPLTLSYKDYVQKEINILNSSEGEQLGEYWQKQLAGELPVLDLPTNASRPPVRTYNGSSYTFKLNNELTQQLRVLAQTEEVSLYDTLLAAFKVLLYRYTGEEDILIALQKARRDKPEYARVVGHFINPVVFRVPFSGSLTFKEVLNQVSKHVWETTANQDYPFPLLVQQFQSKSNFSHSPICQVAFDLQTLEPLEYLSKLDLAAPGNQKKIGELDLEYWEIPLSKAEFDLSLEIIESKDSLIGYFKYNRDLLDADTVAQITRHFQNLLAAIVAHPQQPVAQLSLLNVSERQQLISDWNATQTDYDLSQSIHQLFEEQVEQTPDAIAVIFENQQLTYRELNCRANQLAHYLQTLGVKPEVLVGICVERSLEMVVGLLGILKAGGAYVPIDPGYPQERLAYMLEDSQVPVLLTQEKYKDAGKMPALQEHQARVVCLDTDWGEISQESEENPVSRVSAENLAYVIYTSGSTGKPKGVQICHQSLTNFLYSMRFSLELTNRDILLAVTTISFDIAALELYLPLIVGAQVVLVRREVTSDGSQLLERLVNSGATVMQATPATWNLLLAAGWQSSPQLKILCGGEALPRKLANQLLEKGAAVWNLYGPTETTIWSAAYKVESNQLIARSKEAPESIGRAIANTQIYILDHHLQPVPIGVTGELHIGGVGVGRGYLNRPDLTDEKFIPNPFGNSKFKIQSSKFNRLYKTGDLARYLPDGNIEYVGRIDHQVKIRGFRIELGEIENALSKHPEVREAVVIARSEKSGDKQLVAYVVPNVGAGTGAPPPTPSTLRSFLKQKLPDYMVPAAIVVLESLPLTPNGKLDRRALPTPDTSSFVAASFVAPRDEIEGQLAQIWSEILNIHPVGVKDNFFDLGGHSISAVQLMGKIKQQFGKTLPLTALFPSATIEELAERLQTETEAPTHPCIVPIQPNGNKSPFFCVHPAWGHVLCYVNLSRYLGDEQPFYGLRAIGFDEGEEPLTRVEDMASLYIEAMRTVQPEGPYQVGGWSFGGVVAFEIAQQLHKMGQEVSRLALLDSYMPILLDKNKKIDDVYLVGVLSRVFGGMYGQDNLVTAEELEGLNILEQIEYITDKARRVNIFPAEVEGQDNRRIVDVLVGTLKATYAYQRQPYPGKVTVFRAQEKHIMAPDPTLVWVELFAVLAAKEIEIIKVPGSHYTFVLEPNLPVLAERLGTCLS